MSTVKTVRLSFSAPVHFGSGRLSDSAYTCDAGTLFSALYIEALRCGCADGLLSAACSGALSLSDAFPYIGNDLYLPKPMAVRDIPPSADRMKDTLEKKATKKLPYIQSEHYQAFLDGKLDALLELDGFSEGLGSSFLQTKVNLTRTHKEDAEPYFVGGFRYRQGAGIYFLVKGDYDLVPLLDQLQYSGLGGERTSGYGRFTYRITDENPIGRALVSPSESNANSTAEHAYVLLSAATPAQHELSEHLLAGARYKLTRKGGFVLSKTHHQNAQKKRDIYLFTSGSMFRHTFDGDVFDVNATANAHPVYRYARALWMEV